MSKMENGKIKIEDPASRLASRVLASSLVLGLLSFPAVANQDEIARFDPNMAVKSAVIANGVKWIDG